MHHISITFNLISRSSIIDTQNIQKASPFARDLQDVKQEFQPSDPGGLASMEFTNSPHVATDPRSTVLMQVDCYALENGNQRLQRGWHDVYTVWLLVGG